MLIAVFLAGGAWAECSADQVELRGPWGQARFSVEVADDDQERAQGLMHRESMAKSAGMLFVYDAPIRATFWMKNTLIPLDMIFADETGRVTRVHPDARPLDLTTIDGGAGVQYVLEVNAGIAALYGIGPGSELRHPAIPATRAAWACE